MALRVISGDQAIRAFIRAGWARDRQVGSHVILVKPNQPAVLSAPLHRELAPGTLRSLIGAAGMSVTEFQDLLQLLLPGFEMMTD